MDGRLLLKVKISAAGTWRRRDGKRREWREKNGLEIGRAKKKCEMQHMKKRKVVGEQRERLREKKWTRNTACEKKREMQHIEIKKETGDERSEPREETDMK